MSGVSPWQPTTVRRVDKVLKTSMNTARITTDEGSAYIKAMGNPEGSHVLACELVGTMLDGWFGLSTLEFAIIQLDSIDEIPFHNGKYSKPGPAFITREIQGRPWGGGESELALLINSEEITRLVLFDT